MSGIHEFLSKTLTTWHENEMYRLRTETIVVCRLDEHVYLNSDYINSAKETSRHLDSPASSVLYMFNSIVSK